MLGVFLLTLRELRARWIVVGLFVIATLVWLTLALALQLDVVDGSLAGARLFGNETVDGGDDAGGDDAGGAPFGAATLLEGLVFGAQAFAAGAAYWVGILFALFATGGLVASLQTRGEIDLLLSKPLPRWHILLGRLAGVWTVALGLVAYLIVAVWLVMAIKSGLWSPRFLLAVGVIWAMFVVLYSLVTVVSVTTGSAALSLMVTLAVIFASVVLAIPELDTQVPPLWRPLVTGEHHAVTGKGERASVAGTLRPEWDALHLGAHQLVAGLVPQGALDAVAVEASHHDEGAGFPLGRSRQVDPVEVGRRVEAGQADELVEAVSVAHPSEERSRGAARTRLREVDHADDIGPGGEHVQGLRGLDRDRAGFDAGRVAAAH